MAVLREAYRALAPGGEMYFSDMYCDRRIPQEVGTKTCQLIHTRPDILGLMGVTLAMYTMQLREHNVLLNEGLGGSLYVNDFVRIARQVRRVQGTEPNRRQKVNC
eukprot:1152577-Pelagomonas_calceolata.AAC.4